MSRTQRRKKRTRWFCPRCGGSVMLEAQPQAGKHLLACVACKDETGFPLEAQRLVIVISDPPQRMKR